MLVDMSEILPGALYLVRASAFPPGTVPRDIRVGGDPSPPLSTAPALSPVLPPCGRPPDADSVSPFLCVPPPPSMLNVVQGSRRAAHSYKALDKRKVSDIICVIIEDPRCASRTHQHAHTHVHTYIQARTNTQHTRTHPLAVTARSSARRTSTTTFRSRTPPPPTSPVTLRTVTTSSRRRAPSTARCWCTARRA